MLNISALSLFAYNLLISQLGSCVQRALNAQPETASDDITSYWNYLPGISDYFIDPQSDANETQQEFSESLLLANMLINAFLILPAIQQRRLFGNLLIPVITWNIYVAERIIIFQLSLMWSLWQSEYGLLSYTALLAYLTIMNGMHVTLIMDVIRLQFDCFHIPKNGTDKPANTRLLFLEGNGPLL